LKCLPSPVLVAQPPFARGLETEAPVIAGISENDYEAIGGPLTLRQPSANQVARNAAAPVHRQYGHGRQPHSIGCVRHSHRTECHVTDDLPLMLGYKRDIKAASFTERVH
jgi:hypothetical protein